MLKYQIRIHGTGNNVADYTESVFTCDKCKGNGSLVIDKSDLIEKMEGCTFAQAIYMYRQWKIYGGRVDCVDCSGMGEYTDRI